MESIVNYKSLGFSKFHVWLNFIISQAFSTGVYVKVEIRTYMLQNLKIVPTSERLV